MNFIKRIALRPTEARMLAHLGFVLNYVKLGGMGKDVYNVYVKEC